MGLFGNDNTQQQQQEEEERRRQEQEQKREQEEEDKRKFEERKEYVKNQPGIIIKIQFEGEDKAEEYKFVNSENEYIFMYNFPAYSYYSPDQYEKYFSHEDIRLDKKEYHAELIQKDNETQPSEYIGEILVKQQPISIKFVASNKPEIIISISNLNQDFSSLGTFMRDIGVKNYRNVINIPDESFTVKVINGEEYLSQNTYIIFREERQLYMVRQETYHGNVYIASIDMDEILYYRSEGSLRYEQEISGGGGGGVNYGGAVVGSLLFGNVGALIGSRHNEDVKEIETKTITHDDRLIILALKTQSGAYQIGLNINSEMAFDWLIPEKQYDYVISKRREMYENELKKEENQEENS